MRALQFKPDNHSAVSNRDGPFFLKKSNQRNFRSPHNQGIEPFFPRNLILQPNLTIGQPGDKYEQEADAMADQVIQRLNKSSGTYGMFPAQDAIQPKCAACEKEQSLNTKLQRQSQEEPEVQTQFEEEEEEVQMKAKDEEEVQMQADDEEEENIQKRDQEGQVRRQEEEEEKISTQLHTGSVRPPQISRGLSQHIDQSKGKGQPMADDTRVKMQAAFGADFGNVNIHTDKKAVQMNRELGAQAFTYGRDIYFNRGKYQPGTSRGRHLLAHELTHTIQQGKVQRKIRLQEMETESEPTPKIFTRPKVLWTVENSYSKQPRRALFSREVTTAEQLVHAMYVTPQPMLEPFSILNGVTSEQEIMPFTRIKIPLNNRKATFWAQNGFRNSLYFNGSARNPFPLLGAMGLSSSSGFAARKLQIEENLQMDLPMMIFYIQMGLEAEFIALLKKYANESFTEYPDRYPYGGQYIDKILFHLSGKTKKITKLWVSQITSYYDIIFNHFARADEVRTIRDVYSRLYRGDDGIKEVSYGVVFLEEAFEKALRAAGVPRKDIMSFLNRAGDAISEIIAHPGRFLDHLIAAFKQGFNQFKAKVGEYFTTGLLDWVMRKVGLDNVEIPKDFSPRSLLTAVLQTLKITPKELEALVAEVIGQENVDRIRKVWRIVKTFIRKGIYGLVDQLVDYVGDLKQQLIDNLKNWVITKLVQRAVTEVINMFIPGGNLVAIVKKIYNLIQFVRQRLQEIAELFKAMGESVLSIVKGDISPAAEKIHAVLKTGLYLAIELLGRLVNIKFIDGIRNAIGGLRERVRTAIKKLIEKIAFTGKSAIGKVKHWLGMREKFVTKAGVKHTLYVQERKGVYGLIIETTPMSISSFLTQKYDEVKANENLETSQKKELTRKIKHTRNLVQGLHALMNNPEQADSPRIPNIIGGVTDNLKEIDITGTGTNILIPSAQFTPGFSSGVKAISFTARYIFKGTNEAPPNHEPGSTPSDSTLPDAWQVLRDMGLNYRWVRFHILNENLGGKGVDSNLIPTPTYLNNEYKDEFENDLKNYYNSGVPIWLNANITYDTANFAGYFPSWYSAIGGGMKFENEQWVEDPTKQKRFSKQIDTPEPQSFNINRVISDPAEATLIKNLTSVTQGIIDILRERAPTGGYRYYREMENALEAEVFGDLNREISLFDEGEIENLVQPTPDQIRRANRLKKWLRSAHFTF